MNYNEFTTRTSVNVTTEEFEAINIVYLNSDLDKDEFCKMWSKMNASRVAAAKKAAREQAIIDARDAILSDLVLRWRFGNTDWMALADNDCTNKEKKALAEIGIEMQGEHTYYGFPMRYFKNIGDIFNEVNRHYGWNC